MLRFYTLSSFTLPIGDEQVPDPGPEHHLHRQGYHHQGKPQDNLDSFPFSTLYYSSGDVAMLLLCFDILQKLVDRHLSPSTLNF